MKIIASSICKQGGRDYNQDYVSCSVLQNMACLVTCDGLGSYIGSEVASRLCATKVVETYEQIRDIDVERAFKPEFIQSYIQTAHEYVSEYKEKNPKIKSSCTTVACVVTDCKTTLMAHIGDTRIYFFRQNKLAYQSKDHSLSQVAVEMGEIPLRDIRSHKDQNKLTRVLGSDYYISPDIEVSSEPLSVGDSFILCTDGFWEYVYEEEMEQDLKSSATPIECVNKMEARLLKRINKFNDNYTVLVAMVVEK